MLPTLPMPLPMPRPMGTLASTDPGAPPIDPRFRCAHGTRVEACDRCVPAPD